MHRFLFLSRSLQVNRFGNAFGPALLLVAGAVGILLSSPKWLRPEAVWLGLPCLLYYAQHATIRLKWVWLGLTLSAASAVALLDVMPFPWFVMAFIVGLGSVKDILLYALHRWLVGRQTQFATTLLFPALWTAREYIESRGDIGTFASIANTQYPFSYLVQLVSVTGLWGITFLLYWFAAVVVWAVRMRLAGQPVTGGVGLYTAVLTGVLAFGAHRYTANDAPNVPVLSVGGVTVPSLPIVAALYHDKTGRSIRLDPHIAPGSAALQEANQGLVAFIEQPDSVRFSRGWRAMQRQQDSLFALSQRAVGRGAKLVLWSEGSALLLKANEPRLLARGQAFAARHQTYLLMAAAVLRPGPVMATDGRSVRPFLENKTILIDPTGRVVNVFHKNHPVPMAEPSRPGDGSIPAIQTPYGQIAPSICYDAEHTTTMRQLGQRRIGLLLLPSGDWRAIAPYHSYMAVFRAVENGCSLARQVSGGLSLFTDHRGKVLAGHDAFAPGDNLTVVNMPVAHVPTLYNRFGDWLAFMCLSISAGFLLNALVRAFRRRRSSAMRAKETKCTINPSNPVILSKKDPHQSATSV